METPKHRGAPHSRNSISDICRFIPDGAIGVEFGSFGGESAAVFCESGKFKQLFCVDPWGDHREPTHKKSGVHRDQIERTFDENTAGMPVVKCKMRSDQFVDEYKMLVADFVYIDAMHNYQSVKRDIALALRILKPDGVVAGHDYSSRFEGVVGAVKGAFGSEPDVRFRDTSWLIVLGRER